MKICDLTQSYAPTGGGVRTYIHAKREYIERQGGDEHLLIVPGAEDRVLREGRMTTYLIASPPVPGSPVYRLLLRSDKVLRVLRAERPELVEVHCAYNLPWTALYYRRGTGAPVVGSYMTDLPRAYVQPVATRLFGSRLGERAAALSERYLRALYNRLDATLAISPALMERLAVMGVRNVEYLPMGVDPEVFHPSRRDPALREELGAGEEDLLLIYAGRLDWERRVEVLVQAFERLPSTLRATLVLVGDGPLRETLSARAAESGRMRVLPFQTDRHRLAALLASADLYVSAMPFETFGIAVLEAQACGLPVVGVRAGAMIDRVPPGVGLLGRMDSPEELAANILTVAAAGAGMREMGRRARELAESGFSWDDTFRRVFGLYEELLRAERRTPAALAAPRPAHEPR